MCREMAELGLDIARLAHAAAREEWTHPPHPPEPQAPTKPAPAAHHPPASAAKPRAPRRETPSPSLAFARIIHAVRQVIALEVAISAKHQAASEKAAQILSDRAYRRAETQTQTSPNIPQTPAPQAKPATIPSLLANISREIGIDLEDPTLSDRLPTFLRQTEPTGPPA